MSPPPGSAAAADSSSSSPPWSPPLRLCRRRRRLHTSALEREKRGKSLEEVHCADSGGARIFQRKFRQCGWVGVDWRGGGRETRSHHSQEQPPLDGGSGPKRMRFCSASSRSVMRFRLGVESRIIHVYGERERIKISINLITSKKVFLLPTSLLGWETIETKP